MKKFIQNFWIGGVMAKAIVIIMLAFGVLIITNLMVFQTACSYPYSPKWLCWERMPAYIHPAYIMPVTFALFALLLYWLIKKFR